MRIYIYIWNSFLFLCNFFKYSGVLHREVCFSNYHSTQIIPVRTKDLLEKRAKYIGSFSIPFSGVFSFFFGGETVSFHHLSLYPLKCKQGHKRLDSMLKCLLCPGQTLLYKKGKSVCTSNVLISNMDMVPLLYSVAVFRC